METQIAILIINCYSNNTEEFGGMIDNNQEYVIKETKAVNTMEEVEGKARKQTQGVEDTKSKFNEIANSIKEVKEIAEAKDILQIGEDEKL